MSLERAYLYYNPIPFTVAAGANASENNYRIYCEVRVEVQGGSGTYTKTAAFELEPVDGQAVFYLNSAFRGLLAALPPAPDFSSISENTDRVKRFKVFTGELYNELTEPADLTESDVFTVLLGGIHPALFTDPPMENWATEKRILSHLPKDTLLHASTPFFLSYFVPSAAISTLQSKCTANYTDGTSNTQVLASASVGFGRVFTVPAGPDHAGVLALDPGKTLFYYDFWLEDQAGTALSQVFRFHIDRKPCAHRRHYLYLNSLGGFDTLHCTGLLVFKPKMEKVLSQRFLGHAYNPLLGELQVARAVDASEYEQSTGYFFPDWQRVSEEILRSDRVYLLENGAWVPIIVGDSGTSHQDRDNLKFQRFTYRKAFKSRVA